MDNVVDIKKNKINKIVLAAIVAVVIVVLIALSFTTIPAGYVGVKTQFGAVVGNPLSPGLNFKIPFIQNVAPLDCRTQKIQSDANAASKDLQTVSSSIAVNFYVNPAKATDLYKQVGVNYKEVIVEPAIQEVVKMITAKYTAEELISLRGEASAEMRDLLSEKIGNSGITVTDFNVINFEFTKEFNAAIEQKQIAQQQALKAQQDLERIKIEAEQKVVQAEAEAEALRKQKQEITQDLLKLREIEAQLEAIKKWDGKLPTYTGDGTPFINLNPQG